MFTNGNDVVSVFLPGHVTNENVISTYFKRVGDRAFENKKCSF